MVQLKYDEQEIREAIDRDAWGCRLVPDKQIRGWGQGLALVFLASLLRGSR